MVGLSNNVLHLVLAGAAGQSYHTLESSNLFEWSLFTNGLIPSTVLRRWTNRLTRKPASSGLHDSNGAARQRCRPNPLHDERGKQGHRAFFAGASQRAARIIRCMTAAGLLWPAADMHDFFFYFFGALTLLCGVLVIANPFSRSPVTSAMFLVLAIACLAALFVLLHAFFLAAVQVLIYPGAVMVLFLFVIMLLDLKEEQRRKVKKFGLITGVVSVGAILALFVNLILGSGLQGPAPAATVEGGTIPLGRLLFTQYLLPFEIVSVLLLVAMVGVVLLSKKDLQ